MKKITLLIFAFLSSLTINAQVCQPSVPSSGQGSHELTITSSDPDFTVCPNDCVDLTADFLEVGETDVYAVRSIPFNPSFGFADTLADANLTIDDRWSFSLPLGFDFLFYQQCYTNALLSTNGVIRFNFTAANENTYHSWVLDPPFSMFVY